MIKGHWGINDFLGVKGIFFILLNSEGHLGVKEFYFQKKFRRWVEEFFCLLETLTLQI